MNINGYELTTELKNANSGFSKWGFARKNGREFFIKELITPVYPMDQSIMSDEQFEARRNSCLEYEERFKKFYTQLNNASRGNLVRINDFFRCDSRYYVVTEKVCGADVMPEQIATLDERKKLLVLRAVVRCFCDLHAAGLIHFDVKPANILIKNTINGNVAGKLIDFDSGFFKGEKLDSEEIGGDLTYLAPETFLGILGEDVELDDKADIFALGLVFHQYYTGELPPYDTNEYEYPYELALDQGSVIPYYDKMPEKIGELIHSMLDKDPKKRPSAEELFYQLNELWKNSVDGIKHIIFRFGGAYGKFIRITPTGISYKNTVHPSVLDKTRNFPAYYTAQQDINISPTQFEEIYVKLKNAGMLDIVTPNGDGAVYMESLEQIITIAYENGTVYSYITEEKGNPQFDNLTRLLVEYCKFPEIDPAWFGTPGSVLPPPPPPPPPPPTPATSGSGGWFTQAGDL